MRLHVGLVNPGAAYVGQRHNVGFMAVEAMAEVIRFGFAELELLRFWGEGDPRNPASLRVMEKLGMVKEGHLRHNAFIQGEWCDSVVYGLLREEWRSSANSTAGLAIHRR